MIITTEMLTGLNACRGQVELFTHLTGGSADITEAWCVEHATKFDWDWAAGKLLRGSALAEYQRVEAQARGEYQRVEAQARGEYQRVEAQTFGRLLNTLSRS